MRTGAAIAVKLANGERIEAERGVICSTTPNQLYTRLLEPATLPATVAASVKAYRYGKGNMQIHYALKSSAEMENAGASRKWRSCI